MADTVSASLQLQTLSYSSGEILVSAPSASSCLAKKGFEGVLLFVKLVGLLAFIRGWLQINAHAHGKDGTLGKGLVHLFGGMAAFHIEATIGILASTVAPGFLPTVISGFLTC